MLLFHVNSSMLVLPFSENGIQGSPCQLQASVKSGLKAEVLSWLGENVYNPLTEGETWSYNLKFKLSEYMEKSQKKLDLKAKGPEVTKVKIHMNFAIHKQQILWMEGQKKGERCGF